MHVGKNMGIMTSLKKPTAESLLPPPWRGGRDVHTAPSGDLSVLHPLQHPLIWVGGKSMDDPEQRIAEVQVLLGLRPQP
jgi:hypothetical protein